MCSYFFATFGGLREIENRVDDDLITLAEAARLIPGADADTLKRMARKGTLTVYRPGKAYLTTAADVRAAVKKSQVVPKQAPQRTSPDEPNSLGLSSREIANLALDAALEGARTRRKNKR